MGETAAPGIGLTSLGGPASESGVGRERMLRPLSRHMSPVTTWRLMRRRSPFPFALSLSKSLS